LLQEQFHWEWQLPFLPFSPFHHPSFPFVGFVDGDVVDDDQGVENVVEDVVVVNVVATEEANVVEKREVMTMVILKGTESLKIEVMRIAEFVVEEINTNY